MDRRQFIRIAAAGVATVAVPLTVAGCAAAPDDDVASLARTELVAALGDGSVRAIGESYRTMTPGERDLRSLRAAIMDSRPLMSRWFHVQERSIADLVHADFEQRRTVVVRGWVLSVTEARQCALYSLLPA